MSLLIVFALIAGLAAAAISTDNSDLEQMNEETRSLIEDTSPRDISKPNHAGNPGSDPVIIQDTPSSSEVSTSNTVNEIIEAGDYTIEANDDGGYHVITMEDPGYFPMSSPGDPALPERLFEIPVPQDIDWYSVVLTVNVREALPLHGSYNIAPNPPLEAKVGEIDQSLEIEYDWGYDKVILDGKNILTYGKDQNYPEEPVEMIPYSQRKEWSGLNYINNNYVRLLYRPFLYNPVTQELTLIKTVNVQITFTTTSTSLLSGSSGTTYDYVIITTNDIVANSDRLENFINLKELTHDVLVVTEDDFNGLTGQAPNGRAEKIRQWLIDNYLTMGIDFVLLVGDPDPDDPLKPSDSVGDIPMKMCEPRYFSYEHRDAPTDLFYADLTGNWNLDGDQFFGECVDVAHDESPDSMSVSTDYFSARWEGYVHCDHTEEYKFHTFSDDGVRLRIDGNLEIDHWTEHMPTNNWTTLNMAAGYHDITLEFREHTDDAIIQLWWQTTAAKGTATYVPHQIIPLDHLRNETNTADGLTVRYYNNLYLTGSPDLVRPDGEVINYNWGTGDRGSGGMENAAEVFVGRIPVYSSDYAQLDDILEKIIKYEADAGSLAWRNTILLPMEPMDDNTPCCHLGEGIKNDIATPAGFTSYRIYEEDYNPPTPELWPCNKNNVVNEWKNGYGMTVWATHGSQEGATDIFETSLCPQLDDTKPSFTFQASCATGWPENPNNLAYSLLKNGGIATIGASRVSWYAGGNWTTYDHTSGVYHPSAYYYTKGVITDGFPAGKALAEQKKPIPEVGMNEQIWNLYGDPDTHLLSTVPNVPPVADANGPYTVDEGSPVTFNASGSSDPDGFPAPLEYRWDFDGDGTWDTSRSASPTATFTWSDDYSGTVIVEVSDSVLWDTETTTVTVKNVAPYVTTFLPFSGDEPLAVPITTNASDPGSDDLTFTWEFSMGPTFITVFYNDGMGADPADSYIGGVFPFAVTDSVFHEYGDNGNYTITLTVEDDDDGTTVYTTDIIVDNVDPTIEVVEAYILVNFTLRAAGEKWHNVEMYILENGTQIGFAEVVRYPGSPDDQSVTLYQVKCDVTKVIEVKVLYTPADDPVNGQPNGATPCWVNISFEDGGYNLLHHNFNVQHPDTWEWIFGVNQFFVGHEITFEGTASDPGSDDLTFTWFWDDATPNTVTTYYNDDLNPDPYPSPDGIYPVSVLDVQGHIFTTNGNYDVELNVDDDDGGNDNFTITVILV